MRGWVVAVLAVTLASPAGWAGEDGNGGTSGDENLEDLSLEELLSLDLKVVSAAKREEQLLDTSAAIYVVSSEEIRRIGALSIPEALRVVPGMHVARADGSSWAVATRSFSGRFNTRMLVLIDGRSIYSPLFGGVFWEQQDTMLTDVDRIEAIRGPGGTLWGVNAVNGVINVLSKSAEDTHGLLAVGGGGTEERAFGSVRWGGHAGGLHYRVWSHHHDRGAQALANGDAANDEWKDTRAGFRMDWVLGANDHLTLQGDAHRQRAESTFHYDIATDPFLFTFDGKKDSDSQYVLGRYRHSFSEASGLQTQAYYDSTQQDSSAAQEKRQTADLDVQYDVQLFDWNSIVVGGGFRSSADQWENREDGEFLALDPLEVRDDILNFYLQDEVRLGPVRLILGSKFEQNDYTGLEVQPTARLNVRLDEDRNLWAAVSRAVKTPARLFRDGRAPAGIFYFPDDTTPYRIFVQGNPDLKSEELIAVEGGYRARIFDAVSIDIAAFHNRYKDIVQANQDPDAVTFDPATSSVFVPFDNLDSGEVWGAELSAKWSLNERLAFAGGWSHHRAHLGRFSTTEEKSAPANMANLRIYMNVTENAEWNIAGYYYDVSGRYDPSLLRGNDLVVPPIRRVDMGFTLRPAKSLELSVWGQNLTDERHQEVKEGFVTPTTFVERGVYARLLTRFF